MTSTYYKSNENLLLPNPHPTSLGIISFHPYPQCDSNIGPRSQIMVLLPLEPTHFVKVPSNYVVVFAIRNTIYVTINVLARTITL